MLTLNSTLSEKELEKNLKSIDLSSNLQKTIEYLQSIKKSTESKK